METQIIHYPERDNYVPGQTQYLQGGYLQGAYTTIGSTYVPSQSGIRTQTGNLQGSSSLGRGSNVRQPEGQLATQYVASPTYGSPTYSTNQFYQTGQTYPTGQTYSSGQGYMTAGSGVRG